MPGFLLHQGATILCAHAGQAQATAINTRVLVGGQPTVLLPNPHVVSGCPFVTPGGTPQPCITATWTTGSTRITSNGLPLLLLDSQAICAPNGTPVTIVSTQTRVTGT